MSASNVRVTMYIEVDQKKKKNKKWKRDSERYGRLLYNVTSRM